MFDDAVTEYTLLDDAVNVDTKREAAIVAVYPLASNVLVAPK